VQCRPDDESRMSLIAWAVARETGGVRSYYADEAPGSDVVWWVSDPDEAWAVMEKDWAERVREELAERGHAGTFLTTVIL
jgi:hypothetical protein